MKKFSLIFIFLFIAISENIASEDIKFIKMTGHEKVFFPETGETQLQVSFDIIINKPGSHSLSLGFGKPGSYMSFYKRLEDLVGKQSVKVIAYGDTVYRRQIDFETVSADITTYGSNSHGKTADSISIELPYLYEDFERKTAIPNQRTDVQESVSKLGESLINDQLRDRTNLFKYPGSEPEIEKIELSRWFNIPIIRSAYYDLWTSYFPSRDSRENFIVVAKDKSELFPLRTDEHFNKYIETLELDIFDKKLALSLAQFYLSAFTFGDRSTVLHELPMDLYKEGIFIRYKSFQKWFMQNSEIKLITPFFSNEKEKVHLKFLSHYRHGGVLVKHEFVFHKNGEIISYKKTTLTGSLGHWFLK